MKRTRYMIAAGLVLAIIGVSLILLTISRGAPPVDVQLDQSGIDTISGLYYDDISLHNHGPENVTVLVIIKTPLDDSPRMSDPVQICAGCTTDVLVEESQPPPNQSSDQNQIYLNIILHPDYVHVEYLSTLLGTPIAFEMLPAIGWILVAIGLVMAVYGLRQNRAFRRTRRSR